MKFRAAAAALILALPGFALPTLLPAGQARAAAPAAADTRSAAIERGAYLAHAGDCVACHTRRGGAPFAGGLPLPTPFGTLYSSNITPDRTYGIGAWSAADFYHMLHTGRSRDGTLLYPAMPFPAYTKVTRADSDAIFAYLRSLAPVHQPNHDNELRFPYNNRSLLIGWRALYFQEGEYRPDPRHDAQWNRGAYLVQGLGHCGTCHTAINALGGSSDDKAYAGGLIPMQNWYAPSLTLNKESGLGDWSVQDIAALLKTGVSSHGAVYGPMAEVVENSLQYLSDDDARAMAVYLKTLPARDESAPAPPARDTSPAGAAILARGGDIYRGQCESCHRRDGAGQPPGYPPLAGNPSIEMQSAVNPIRMVLNGGYPPQTAGNPRPYGMPPFAQVLSDADIAAVVSYIRMSWGNHGQQVGSDEVNRLRAAPILD